MLTTLRGSDIELLRLFMVVADCGGFSAAQSRLNVTQSTISAQMSKLESRLGYRLCDRGRGGFRLTTKGAQVLAAGRALADALNEFLVEARDVAGRLLGDLNVGLADNVGGNPSARFDAALAAFRDRAPEVALHLVVGDPDELERRVLAGGLHVAVSYTAAPLPELEYRRLFGETQSVYCGRRHRLFAVRESAIDELELAGADWAEAHYTLPGERRMTPSAGNRATADHVDAILQLVLSGHFIGYLPDHYAAPFVAGGDLRALHGKELGFTVDFYAITRRSGRRSDLLNAFLADLFTAHGG